MTEISDTDFDVARAKGDVPAARVCLRCKTVFQSEGFGERICRPCKGTQAWRNAMPVRRGRERRRASSGKS